MTVSAWPDFYFARHGETDWNRERRYQGSRDIPLNETGRRQADASGILLRDLLEREGVDPSGLDWFASPLSRASETMDRMRKAFDAPLKPVIHDTRLIEISFGALEGLLHDEVVAAKVVAPGQRDASYWHFRPENGENYVDVSDRLTTFAERLTHNAVVVAHGGILRVLRHLVEGMPQAAVLNWPPPQGAVAHFRRGSMALYTAQRTW